MGMRTHTLMKSGFSWIICGLLTNSISLWLSWQLYTLWSLGFNPWKTWVAVTSSQRTWKWTISCGSWSKLIIWCYGNTEWCTFSGPPSPRKSRRRTWGKIALYSLTTLTRRSPSPTMRTTTLAAARYPWTKRTFSGWKWSRAPKSKSASNDQILRRVAY